VSRILIDELLKGFIGDDDLAALPGAGHPGSADSPLGHRSVDEAVTYPEKVRDLIDKVKFHGC
jgi:hypothetical protein